MDAAEDAALARFLEFHDVSVGQHLHFLRFFLGLILAQRRIKRWRVGNPKRERLIQMHLHGGYWVAASHLGQGKQQRKQRSQEKD